RAATTTSATTAGLSSPRRPTASSRAGCRVTLIQNLVSGGTLHRRVPGPCVLAIPIRIHNLTTQAAGGLFAFTLVFGFGQSLIVDLRVEPAEHRSAQFVVVNGFVGIVIELEMVRAVARLNQLPFLSLRIVVRRLTAAAREREPFGVPVA